MGIPFYFYAIINQFDNIVGDNVPKNCKRFFIDFNSIIHNTAYAILSKEQDVDTHIFTDIIDYVHSLLKICTPNELLYIAIDGVAPCAKMHQQRKRRYMSSFRNNLVNNFKRKNGAKVIEWDSNQITPGTDFMNRLNVYLKEYFDKNKFDFDVILSGSDEPKEGEHKFIRYIKDNPVENENGCDVIYGLDADLIMLSLTCNQPRIYLMREMTNFQTIKKPDGLSDTAKQVCFKYLEIDALRKAISLYLYDSDEIEYMNDYVFMCFLLGNDFLPSFPFLKLRQNALDILCTAYKKAKHDLHDHLIRFNKRTEEHEINFEFLKVLLELISKHEDEYITLSTKEYNACRYNTNRRPNCPIEKYALDLDNYPIMNSMTKLIDPINDNKWRMSYYHYLFTDISLKDIKSVCLNYIEGLIWNMNYYFNKEYSTTWYYKYPYPPSMSDLFNNMCIMNDNDFNAICEKVKSSNNNVSIDANMQLLMVLPPQSIDIVPDKLKCIMQDVKHGCAHYYPSRFHIITYMKYHLWECVPVLPDIDIHHLHSTLLKL
jgi:5'-3' exonuclease